ncbi:hypothetical protein DESC_720295 [Desulfosarcina cetonica]|nr:hypothetical protein DESC_720295 [Desulfosarcina cetonica]
MVGDKDASAVDAGAFAIFCRGALNLGIVRSDPGQTCRHPCPVVATTGKRLVRLGLVFGVLAAFTAADGDCGGDFLSLESGPFRRLDHGHDVPHHRAPGHRPKSHGTPGAGHNPIGFPAPAGTPTQHLPRCADPVDHGAGLVHPIGPRADRRRSAGGGDFPGLGQHRSRAGA